MTVRRGICPGLADPLPTGDGLLARLAVARAISLDAVAALCAAAQAYGNGIIEITSRGSIQVRGLTTRSTREFAAAIAALDVADAASGRVLASPLAGLDRDEIFDVSEVAGRLRKLMVESGLAAKLAPKVSVIVDGGGSIHLDAIPCDIRLRASATSAGIRFHLALARGGATAASLGTVALEHAVEAALELLHAIAAHGPTARARDLIDPARFARDHALPRGAQSTRSAAQSIGTHALRDGSTALGVGLPFGHSDADTLQKLIQEAQSAGAALVRPAPDRVLFLIGVLPAQVSKLVSRAERLGFITKPDDRRRRVVACAGSPACLSAEIATRVLAPAIAAAARFAGPSA